MYLSLAEKIIFLYGFELLSSFLSFQFKGFPLVFLIGQVQWLQMPSAFILKCLKISLIFAG